MNNYHIEFPWWAGVLFVMFVIGLLCLLAYYMYEAFLKFLLVWKHGHRDVIVNIDTLHKGDIIIKNDQGIPIEELQTKIAETLLKAVKESEVSDV